MVPGFVFTPIDLIQSKWACQAKIFVPDKSNLTLKLIGPFESYSEKLSVANILPGVLFTPIDLVGANGPDKLNCLSLTSIM